MYNLITTTGVTAFLYPYLYYNSKRGFIIFINGILYHCTGNTILKYYDITWNSFITLYTVYYCNATRKYGVAGFFFWILNTWLYNNNHINKTNSSIIHVVGTQWILLIGLLKSLKDKKLIKNI